MKWWTLLACGALGAQTPDFSLQVHPLLRAKCGGCHGTAKQGGLNLSTWAGLLAGGSSGPAIVPGKSAESLLLLRVTGEREPRMPLGGELLGDRDVAMLKRWIDAGAPGAEATSAPVWKPSLAPRKVALPAGAAHPVDALLATRGEPVSDALFARRAYFDLWGMGPTPEQLDALERSTDPAKRAKLIDALLSDNARYSGHWISFWNDALRNDEGVVYHGERRSITPWLEDALRRNLPYDEFVRRLLHPRKKGDPGGFLLGVNWRGEIPASERPPLQAAQASAQVFLGVNLKCNSCHDSFISRWKLKDAYGLASFFSNEELEIVRCDVPTGEKAEARFLYPELGAVKPRQSLERRREGAARLFTMRGNGRFTRTYVNRIWKQLFGRGLVEPADDMDAQPWNEDLLDWLAEDFRAHGYDTKHLLRRLMTSTAYQLPSVTTQTEPGRPYGFRGPDRRRLTAEQFADTLSALTGEWRVKEPSQPGLGEAVREWRMKSTPLTRALGRPIRDQVITQRQAQPTTLQALELVNGATLAAMLERGARRMLGRLPEAPPNLFDSGVVRKNEVAVDVDVSGLDRVYLLIEDAGSYDPERVKASWGAAELSGPEGVRAVEFTAAPPAERVVGFDGERYQRFRARVSVDKASLSSDINAMVRFFVFGAPPDRKRLVRVAGDESARPVPEKELADRVFRHLLGRAPAPAEREMAARMLGEPVRTEGLEDLLWALTMSPEFQYIR